MITEDDVDAFFEHHGIKGMHWGVRKAEDSSGGNSGSNHAKVKKALIIGGVVLGAAAITAGTIYAAKHGDLPLRSFSSGQKTAGKKIVEDLAKPKSEELTGIVHATGGKYLSDRVRSKGGLTDLYPELQKAGLAEGGNVRRLDPGEYRRYGDSLEKVAVRFQDPAKRTDFAGRPIIHDIVLPKQHTEGIDSFDSAQKKAWGLTKDAYEKFYQYTLSPQATNEEARRLKLMD